MMDLLEVRRMAVALMQQHGVGHWRLVFDRAKTRAGLTRFDRREISLSAPLMRLQAEDQVRDTILHEIAHALTGPQHAHDSVWQATAMRIGGSGQVRLRTADLPRADWVGTCPAGHEARRHRRPAQPLSCAACAPRFSVTAILTWTFRGRPAPMTPAYRAKERAIRARAVLAGASGGGRSELGA